MLCLGIESTAHTFGVGIIDEKGRIKANEKSALQTEEGGLIPRELSEHHSQVAPAVVEKALVQAGVDCKDIDVIAFSQGPGIGQALRTGAVAARTLSLLHNKPLVGVNHCIAHIEIGKKLTRCTNPLTVYASGANTQIIGFESSRYRVYGETLDLGLGNMLDSFGRKIGLGFPAGPKMDEMYAQGKKYLQLPYSVKGMDLVFAGLATAAEKKIGKVNENDLVFSLMHNAFAMLTEVTERALAHTEKKELLLAGGVAASPILKNMLETMCWERKAKLFVPERSVLVDNGAMIAWLGLLAFQHGGSMTFKQTQIKPKQRTDQVKVNWL
jgi:universal protein Kae1